MAQTSRLVIELDSRDAEAKAADTRKALEALEDAGLSIQPALNKAGAGMEKMGKGAEKATKSIEDEADELERLLGQIDPVTRRLGELDKQEQALAKHRKEGNLDKATFDDYQAKISEARADLGRFNVDMAKTGISAKQTAAALRGVPAQFTDIATSLQGGQAPLTVFLQQGGQLKDMFGGVGPAAKALGGYVAGLITPFTLAGAAVAGFTLAAYKGYEQSEQYRKALTLTGDAAGKTADDLIAMSNAIAGGRNFEEAGQAVLALAGNGRLTGEAFTEVARAATEISVATGKSAADIADQLSSTKGSVTELAAEYSDKYGVITLAVFEQVRALEQQGDRMGAIKVLAGEVADEMGARNREMVESTRGLAKAWDDVKTSVSGVWNELKAGLSASPELFKLQHLQGQLQDAQKIGDKALITGLEKQVALAQAAVDAKSQASEAAAAEVSERKALVSADEKWYALTKKEMTDQAKLAKDIADARKLGVEAGKSQADIDGVVANIQAKYDKSQPKTPKAKAYAEDAGMKMLDSSRQAHAVLVQQNAAISEQGTKNEKLGAQAQALIRWEQQLAELKSKGTLTADQKALLASQDLITAQLKKNSALEKEVELRKASKEEAEKLAAFQANQNSRLGTAQDGLDSQVAGMGLGSEARDRLKQDLAIQRDYARQSADLLEQRNTGRIPQDLYDKESAVIQDGLNKRLAMQQNYYSQIDTYQSNWLNGVTAGWNSYAEISQNTAQQTQDIVTGSLDTITTGFGNSFSAMALDGKSLGDVLSNTFEGLVRGVLDGLGQMAAQWLINQGIQLAFGQTETALHATKLAMISTETAAEAAGAATVATAKVTADGIATASSLTATATTTTAQVAAAGTTLASWLPAALVASIGSFGAAAVVGGGALLAAFALIKGFSNGGYTGAGGVNEPAGTVHKGEVVWSQADIRRAGGVATVEAMRKGNVSVGSASGGSGATASSPSSPVAQSPAPIINVFEDKSRAGQVNARQQDGQWVIDVVADSFFGEGELHQVGTQKYGWKSQGT
jgi:lambda family phage tail tape measure protein